MQHTFSYLLSKEVLFEDIVPSKCDIHCTKPHVEAKQEEIAVVVVAYTVVQPGWSVIRMCAWITSSLILNQKHIVIKVLFPRNFATIHQAIINNNCLSQNMSKNASLSQTGKIDQNKIWNWGSYLKSGSYLKMLHWLVGFDLKNVSGITDGLMATCSLLDLVPQVI